MNAPAPTNPHQLWDDYRDGDLDADSRRAFERYLSDNPDLADRYVEETRWLGALKRDDAPLADTDPAFRERVLSDWLAAEPVGFIRRHRALFAAAASIAVVVSLVWVAGRHGPTPDDRPQATRIVDRPVDNHAQEIANATVIDDTPRINPVSQMVLSISNSAEAPPRQIRQTLGIARAMLSGDRLLELLGNQNLDAPDPAATPDTPAAPRS